MAYDCAFKWTAGFLHSLSRSLVAPVTDARSAERSDAGAPATTRFDEAAKAAWDSVERVRGVVHHNDKAAYLGAMASALRTLHDEMKYEREAAVCNMQQIISDLREPAQSGSVGVDVKECQRQMLNDWPDAEEVLRMCDEYRIMGDIFAMLDEIRARMKRTRLESNGGGV